jgi:hypothetical protein
MEFERVWHDRRPTPARSAAFVESVALVFPSTEGATAALDIPLDLARYVLLDQEHVGPSADRVSLGDESTVLGGGRNFSIVWRKGTVVALLHVRGRSEPSARLAALSLARRQEGRIEHPSPLPPGVNDDREVKLDNPHLGTTVYWIGRRFRPGRGLPSLRLAYVEAPLNDREPAENGEGPGYRADLDYQGKRDGIVLDVWRSRRWERFRRSRGGKGFWDRPCARKRVISLRRGHAELFRSCAKRHPRFVAHAFLRSAVVEVAPYCLRCAATSGAYGSFKGLATVVRALHPRRPRA